MGEIQTWVPDDNSNVDLFPENMPFSGVNNGGRAVQGLLARWFQDTDGSNSSSGSSNVFSVTSTRDIPALFDNLTLAFTANHSITAASTPTLNLNGLGAKQIRRINNFSLVQGDIVAGQPVFVIYKQAPDVWFMVTASSAVDWSPAQVQSLTDASTIAIDMSVFFNFVVSLGGNRTLGTPTGAQQGKTGVIIVRATGATRTLSLSSAWTPNSGIVFPISIVPGQQVNISYWQESPSGNLFRIFGLWEGAQ